jgi:hypothetical protein
LRKFSDFLEDFGQDAGPLEMSMGSLSMTDHGEACSSDCWASTTEQHLDNLVDSLSEWEGQVTEEARSPTVAAEPTAEPADDEYFDGTSFMVAGVRGRPVGETGGTAHRARWQRRWVLTLSR